MTTTKLSSPHGFDTEPLNPTYKKISIKFQRNTFNAAPRASYKSVTKGNPLILGPSLTQSPNVRSTFALPCKNTVEFIDNGLMQRLDTLQQYFDQSISRAMQDHGKKLRILQTQIQTLIGNVKQLQGNVLEVDDHCRRTDERLGAWKAGF